MTKTDKLRVRYIAVFAWREWTRYTEMAGGDPWLHIDRRQANRDILMGMQHARLIEDFSLAKGVLIEGEWHTLAPVLTKFKAKGKPVEVRP